MMKNFSATIVITLVVGLFTLFGIGLPGMTQECEVYEEDGVTVAACVDEDGNAAVSAVDEDGNQVTIAEDEEGNTYTEIIEVED
jgi:hypothetical protein